MERTRRNAGRIMMRRQSELSPDEAMDQLVRRTAAIDSVMDEYDAMSGDGNRLLVVLPGERAAFMRDLLLAIEDADACQGGASWTPGWKSVPDGLPSS